MAASSAKKLPLEPRLPVVGGADYDQQLSRALHDILRQLSTRVNALGEESSPGFYQVTAEATTVIPPGVQFVNLIGSSNVNTLGGGEEGRVVIITCDNSPTLYALGIFTPLTPNSIVIAEFTGGDWYLRGLSRNVDAVVAYGTGTWAGTTVLQNIPHGLGYPPDISKVQTQIRGTLPSPLTSAASLIMSVSAVDATNITVVRQDYTHAYGFTWRIYS